jgi:hypothetical protein
MPEHHGSIYTYAFNAAALSTAGPSDLWVVTAPSDSRLAIREIEVGQYSDAGDAQAEMVPLLFMTGSTSTGGGSAITGLNVRRYSGAAAPSTNGGSVTGPSTTLASTASATVIRPASFNVMGGFRYYPVPNERLIIGLSQRFVLRLGTPNDPLTVSGVLTLQELGKRSA